MIFNDDQSFATDKTSVYNCYQSKGGRVYTNEVSASEYENLFLKRKTKKIGKAPESRSQRRLPKHKQLDMDSIFGFGDEMSFMTNSARYHCLVDSEYQDDDTPPCTQMEMNQNNFEKNGKKRSAKLQQRSTVQMIGIIDKELCDVIYALQGKMETLGGYGCKYENGDLTCRSGELGLKSSRSEYEINSLKLKSKALFFEGLNLVKTYHELNLQFANELSQFDYIKGLQKFVTKGVKFDKIGECLEAVTKIRRKLHLVIKDYEKEWSVVSSYFGSDDEYRLETISKNMIEGFDNSQDNSQLADTSIYSLEYNHREARTPRTRAKNAPKKFNKTSKKFKKGRNCPTIQIKVTQRSKKTADNNNADASPSNPDYCESIYDNELEERDAPVTLERFKKVENQLQKIMKKLEKMQVSQSINSENKENLPRSSIRATPGDTIQTKSKSKFEQSGTHLRIKRKQIKLNSFDIPPPQPFRTTTTQDEDFDAIQSRVKISNSEDIRKLHDNSLSSVHRNITNNSLNHTKKNLKAFNVNMDSVNGLDPHNIFWGKETSPQDTSKPNRKTTCFKKPIIQPEIFITPPSSIYTCEIDYQKSPESSVYSKQYKKNYKVAGDKANFQSRDIGNESPMKKSDIHVIKGTLDGNNFTLNGKESKKLEEIEIQKLMPTHTNSLSNPMIQNSLQGSFKRDRGANSKQIYNRFEEDIHRSSYTLSDVNSLEYEIYKVREERAHQILILEKSIKNVVEVTTSDNRITNEFVDQNIFQVKISLSGFMENYNFSTEHDKQFEKNAKILRKKLDKAKSLLSQSCLLTSDKKKGFVKGIHDLVAKSVLFFAQFLESAKDQYRDILMDHTSVNSIQSESNVTTIMSTSPCFEKSQKIGQPSEISVKDFEQISNQNGNGTDTSSDVFDYSDNIVDLTDSGVRKDEITSRSRNDEEDSQFLASEDHQDNLRRVSTGSNEQIQLEEASKMSMETNKELKIIVEKSHKMDLGPNLEIVDCGESSQGESRVSEEFKEEEKANEDSSSLKVTTMRAGYIEDPGSSGYQTSQNSHTLLTSATAIGKNILMKKKTFPVSKRNSDATDDYKAKAVTECFDRGSEKADFDLQKNWSEDDFNGQRGTKVMSAKAIPNQRSYSSHKKMGEQSNELIFDERKSENNAYQKRLEVPPVGFHLDESVQLKSELEFDLSNSVSHNEGAKKVVKIDVNVGKGKISVIKLIPNSDKCAIGFESGELVFFSISEKSPIYCKRKHKGAISCIEFLVVKDKATSTYKRYIVTGESGEGNSLIVWDSERMKALKKFSGHKMDITSIKHLGDNATIASSSLDGKVALWDLSSKFGCIQLLESHTGPISSLYLDSKEALLLSGTLNGEIIVWKIFIKEGIYDAVSFQKKIQLNSHIIDIKRSVSLAGKVIILESDAKIRLYDLISGKCELVVESEDPYIDFVMIERGKATPIMYCVKKESKFEIFENWGQPLQQGQEENLIGNEVNPKAISFIKEMFRYGQRSQVLVKDKQLFMVGFEEEKKRLVFRPIHCY